MSKYILTIIKEVETKDLHEAVEQVCDDPMEYMLFTRDDDDES